MSVNGSGPSDQPTRLGEVIEASTVEFTAESYELHESPAFGSFVRVGRPGNATYGLVLSTCTASLDPGRRPIARGRDLATEAEIFQNHPQIARLLRTEFRALVVGYEAGGQIYHRVAPHPVHIHAFVWECPPAEIERFTERCEYLRLLAGTSVPGPLDDLIAAAVRQAAAARGQDETYLIATGRYLASLLAGQYQRLNNIIQQLRS